MMASGGTRVEDVEVLRADEGLKNSLGWGSVIGSDTLLNFIGDRRSNARSRRVNEAMVIKAMKEAKEEEFTYDNDATYIDSKKKSSRYSYQGEKQFSGLIGCISELGLINTVEYRRGNISPQTGILNQLRKAVKQAKAAEKRIKVFRSDSAAHQIKIITFCDIDGIEYYITMDKNKAVMKAIERLKAYDWKTMDGRYKESDRQWAVTKYVVTKGFSIRILIMRWKNPDPDLFDVGPYCYQVIGTNNRDIEPMEWLERHNGRMGSIEQLNKEIKTGMGCDYTPSHEFEKNRGYFLLGVLAHNMVQIMKLFYFGESTRNWTIKTLRYQFINVCGRIVKTGRRFYCKIINVTNEMFELFRYCKARLSVVAH
ncbi:MAG: IS1380 family transposase, partial [Candidatus Omnitrophica bacterium]|nr:IS1380 family transposase [Candidatus Omnitrophota bacterium]